MIAYRATLDAPRELVPFVAKVLAAERRRRGTPAGSSVLTCFGEAVLALRWFRGRTSPGALARDHGISRATVCRYVDEVTGVGPAPSGMTGPAPSGMTCAKRWDGPKARAVRT